MPGPFLLGTKHPVVVPHIMGFLDPSPPYHSLSLSPSEIPRSEPTAPGRSGQLQTWGPPLYLAGCCPPINAAQLCTLIAPWGINLLLGMFTPHLCLNCWVSESLWPCECHLPSMACSFQLSGVLIVLRAVMPKAALPVQGACLHIFNKVPSKPGPSIPGLTIKFPNLLQRCC